MKYYYLQKYQKLQKRATSTRNFGSDFHFVKNTSVNGRGQSVTYKGEHEEHSTLRQSSPSCSPLSSINNDSDEEQLYGAQPFLFEPEVTDSSSGSSSSSESDDQDSAVVTGLEILTVNKILEQFPSQGNYVGFKI